MKKKTTIHVAFVVTVAAVAGCDKELPTVNPPPRNPPRRTPSVHTAVVPSARPPATASASQVIATDPPSTVAKRAVSAPKAGLVVTKSADGRCWQRPPVPKIDCPPPEEGTTCNPPPPPTPREVRCLPTFEEVRGTSKSIRLDRRKNGTCYASYHCVGRCNPPAPRRVSCPPKAN